MAFAKLNNQERPDSNERIVIIANKNVVID